MANNSLRSFASGMIIATSILTAIYYFQPTSKEEGKIVEVRTITEEEVQQFLNDKGHISIPKQTYEELMKKKAATAEQKTDANVKTSETPKSEELHSDKTNKANNSQPAKQPPKETATKQVEPIVYKLEITRGMDSIQIANKLENAGIVKSSKEFEKFLNQRNWTRSIQIGTYNLNNEMSYEQIGRMITHK